VDIVKLLCAAARRASVATYATHTYLYIFSLSLSLSLSRALATAAPGDDIPHGPANGLSQSWARACPSADGGEGKMAGVLVRACVLSLALFLRLNLRALLGALFLLCSHPAQPTPLPPTAQQASERPCFLATRATLTAANTARARVLAWKHAEKGDGGKQAYKAGGGGEGRGPAETIQRGGSHRRHRDPRSPARIRAPAARSLSLARGVLHLAADQGGHA
jgi:hypothetical protein